MMNLDPVLQRYIDWVSMNRYERVLNDLDKTGVAIMKCFGNSMTPRLKSGSLLTYNKQDTYKKGDIVFCKVKGNYIDAHIITKVNKGKGYMISNNHGHDNGWTKQVYGKVVQAVHGNNRKTFK
jgi:phage repressor protein C with HTH and peptisase S24 domain